MHRQKATLFSIQNFQGNTKKKMKGANTDADRLSRRTTNNNNGDATNYLHNVKTESFVSVDSEKERL